MEVQKTDICILGAGAGGLSVASVAAQLNLKTILIEKNKMGGDCLNYGCVPSKSLLAAAKKLLIIKKAKSMGVYANDIEIKWDEVKAHVKHVIKTIEPHDSKARFESLGAEVILGSPKFVDDKTVEVNDIQIKAKYFVIATGSSANIVPINGLENVHYLTNETIFDIEEKPKHLITIGAGPIGCELSQAFRLLHSEVSIIDIAKMLPIDDKELTDIIRVQFQNDGINLYEKVQIEAISKSDNPEFPIKVTIKKNNVTKEIYGSHLLMATGRKANLEHLGLDNAKIDYSKRGISVDHRLRTNKKYIYAIGDCIGDLQFTHMAGFHASIVIQNMFFKLPKKYKTHATPWVTYTYPELAHIAPLFSELKKDSTIKILKISLKESDRAQAENETNGAIKIAVNKKGIVLAASIVSPIAGEMIYPWIMAVTQKMKLKKIIEMIPLIQHGGI